MSIEVILIPIGIAAFTALREHRRTDLCVGCRTTRITDADLLERGLREMGAQNIVRSGQVVTASTHHGSVTFQSVDGTFLGRVDRATEDVTMMMLGEFDRAVGLMAQRQTLEDVRTRASQLGLRLIGEEVEEDGTVQLLFEEEAD